MIENKIKYDFIIILQTGYQVYFFQMTIIRTSNI